MRPDDTRQLLSSPATTIQPSPVPPFRHIFELRERIGEGSARGSFEEKTRMGNSQQKNALEAATVATVKPLDWDAITLSSEMGVDSRRLMNALSIPEYIEAWLQPPGLDELLVFDFLAQDRFQIDLYRSEARRASIHAYTRVLSTDQICYAWKIISPAGILHTTVDFALSCRQNRCNLSLRHAGFHTMQDQTWHTNMWRRSMMKLREIVRAR